MIKTNCILKNVDIASIIEASLGQPNKKNSRWLFWSCPFHPGDHNPSLGVTPENGRWFCFACRKGGDAITWLMDFQGLSFKDACEQLGARTLETPQSDKPPINSTKRANHPHYPDHLRIGWAEVIAYCEEMLWEPNVTKARTYLQKRGLRDATLRSPYFRIGYSPGIEISGIWVDRGIVIPCFTTTNNLEVEYISYIKIRRPNDKPKYKKLPGNGANLSGLFGAEWAIGADILYLTEGEFDAMLLHQEAGDLVGVCTLGSASDQLNFARFGKYILAAKHIITAYDSDDAGRKGAEGWMKLSARVHCALIPQSKDITEFWESGGDLASWVMEILRDLGIT